MSVQELHPEQCVHVVTTYGYERRCKQTRLPGSQCCRLHDPDAKAAQKAHRKTALYQAECAVKTRAELLRTLSISDPGCIEVRKLRNRYIGQLEECADLLIEESQQGEATSAAQILWESVLGHVDQACNQEKDEGYAAVDRLRDRLRMASLRSIRSRKQGDS